MHQIDFQLIFCAFFLAQASFKLEALDQEALAQNAKSVRPKRKRRLLIDDKLSISPEDMNANMADYGCTMQSVDLAPPTKILMRIKESNTADKLLSTPAVDIEDGQLVRVSVFVFG